MEELIKKFLAISDGSGYGYGSGYGSGLHAYNNQKVYVIDGIQTLIHIVHNQYAFGEIIKSDLTLTPCYIAKVGNYFAHADTLAQAQKEAREKYEENKPIDERIDDFIKQYPSLDTKAQASDLFLWHHVLTGSCEMGRKEFCRSNDISWEKGEWSIKDFLDLTINAYGGDIIKQVINRYKNQQQC